MARLRHGGSAHHLLPLVSDRPLKPTAPPPCTDRLCSADPLPAPLFARGRLDADHPDRNGEQLRKIAPVLKLFAEEAKKYGGKVGVFIDYCSLPQRSRASHRAGAAAAEAARAAAKAAGTKNRI